MTPVETDYRFVGTDGEVGLLDLFAGRRQLLVYRFFYEPDVTGWPDKACGGCSYFTDHMPRLAHVNVRDTTFVMVSPADQNKITTLKQRMGWDVPWYTLLGDTFSNDVGVAEMFGLNVFLRVGERVGAGARDRAHLNTDTSDVAGLPRRCVRGGSCTPTTRLLLGVAAA